MVIGQIIAEFRAHDRLRTTYFCLVSDHGHHGGRTGHLSLFDVAHEVLRLCDQPSELTFAYVDALPLWEKVRAVAQKVYGAADVDADPSVRAAIEQLQRSGYGHFPICIAKTQYSFSSDATLRGAPTGHQLTVREVRLAAGAEFIVMVCGDVMTMPGLPKVPGAEQIDIDDDGQIVGLF